MFNTDVPPFTVDSDLYSCLDFLIILTMTMLIKLAAVTIAAPFYIIPGILLAAAGGYICQVYMKAQLSVKREKSNARAPVLGHFGAAFAGLGECGILVLRRLTKQGRSVYPCLWRTGCLQEGVIRTDRQILTSREDILGPNSVSKIPCSPNQTNGTSWVNIRIEFSSAMFSTGLAFYLVYGGGSSSAAQTGFTLNMAGTHAQTRCYVL